MGNRNNNYGRQEDEKILTKYTALDNITYVDRAERVIKNLRKNRNSNQTKNSNETITTTKIRSILRMLNEVQKRVAQSSEKELNRDLQSALQYYKMRCVYEAGRETSVKTFMKESELIELVKWIGSSKSRFQLYCHYVEALVAFHRYYGGKD